MTHRSLLAEKIQHHSEQITSINKVTVRLITYSANGLTELDFTLAERMNEAEKTVLR